MEPSPCASQRVDLHCRQNPSVAQGDVDIAEEFDAVHTVSLVEFVAVRNALAMKPAAAGRKDDGARSS